MMNAHTEVLLSMIRAVGEWVTQSNGLQIHHACLLDLEKINKEAMVNFLFLKWLPNVWVTPTIQPH
jgi:hypothetical protein